MTMWPGAWGNCAPGISASAYTGAGFRECSVTQILYWAHKTPPWSDPLSATLPVPQASSSLSSSLSPRWPTSGPTTLAYCWLRSSKALAHFLLFPQISHIPICPQYPRFKVLIRHVPLEILVLWFEITLSSTLTTRNSKAGSLFILNDL